MEKQKKLFDIRGAELIRRGLHSIDELEEEDYRNRKIRLTTKRSAAIIVRNDVFDPEALDRLLSGVLGSIDRIIKAVYHNTLGS